MFTDPNPYFSVPHPFTVYLNDWPSDAALPSELELKAMQSIGLQLLSEVKSLEASCLVQLRHLDNDAKSVMEYLRLQSRKIDLVLQHVLESETQEGDKYSGIKFGGSGIEFLSSAPFETGKTFKTTLYIRDELVAILCMAQVSQCVPNPDNAHQYLVELSFSQIIDEDVEHLVKASLSVQQKLLKQRKLAKG